jgi:hypothetical protein
MSPEFAEADVAQLLRWWTVRLSMSAVLATIACSGSSSTTTTPGSSTTPSTSGDIAFVVTGTAGVTSAQVISYAVSDSTGVLVSNTVTGAVTLPWSSSYNLPAGYTTGNSAKLAANMTAASNVGQIGTITASIYKRGTQIATGSGQNNAAGTPAVASALVTTTFP